MKYIATILTLTFALSSCSKDAEPTADVAVTDARTDARSDAAPDATADAEQPNAHATHDAASPTDAATPDATSPDIGEDTSSDDTGSDADHDTGALSLFDAEVTVDGTSLSFDRAFYGRTDGAYTNSGFNEYHIEIHRGGIADCPEQDSPSPSQTVIVTNVVIPTSPGESQAEADGLVVTFLDFFGDLTDEVLLSAENEKITWIDLAQEALVFEIDAPVDGGAITGTVVATRCESLDL